MRYYLIAGEASGDLHGSNLVKALRKKDSDAMVQGWGGDLMNAAGVRITKHYRDLAFMGFYEVVKNIATIRKNFKTCKADILAFQPDVVILIDYPGFNLRMAKWIKKKGFKIIYYISPQIWAWHTSRVHNIKKFIDQMLVILPFEKIFYKQYNYEVDFVGHPLLDHLVDLPSADDFRIEHDLDDRPVIALLPGSRKQEIKRMLTGMLAVVDDFKNYQFVIAGAPAIPLAYYRSLVAEEKFSEAFTPKVVNNQTYKLLSLSHAALVTSGTATLETALFDVPQVVCYDGNPLSFQLARKLVKVKYISLVNLVLDYPLVKELIQSDFNKKKITTELNKILDKNRRYEILAGYADLRKALGNVGASERAAEKIAGLAKKVSTVGVK